MSRSQQRFKDILDASLNASCGHGDIQQSIRKALEDGRLDSDEKSEIRALVMKQKSVWDQVLNTMDEAD